MELNKNVGLILSNYCYVYDIISCHFTILDKLGYDVSSIEKHDKLKRNIQIGYILKENPKITSILRKTTESLVDEFIFRNHINNDEIIVKSYDGIIITKPINNPKYSGIGLKLREIYQKFIISNDRCNYIALNDQNETIIKGISNRYKTMDYYYSKLLRINYMNKTSIFKSIQNIKDEILNSDNPELFCIPTRDDDKYIIRLVRYNEMEISNTIIQMLDVDDIDKEFYFNKYLEPFVKSIVITYI